ncbi:thioredoxin domain-containing protein [Rhodococcus sp. BP-252]|uniref:Thioredoxin n=1 Tax=Rhodococcoides kyotonense TaxID=398843 RepID=A0A177YL89_9NOCA|nr:MULTISPECIES: thioredoxin domain-containing protein [Rhodococcus]MBY6413956.1 thioredoxin domain-containing protein [Rhodococcus sp. BP-320]MBY6418594.1 thioredoxin domain-containing protein [Rhodococcus sp. BP-321]MBY6422889.1 thioredoxin domain-containing protein [Rhodococcus sp. BP-324]MBY6428762.1 thioredoxin domain-containing protein [Rhodococcus sp. BP-323]MBY6433715.1 thioredoxin domain-containing protein [Rhodococcus sp. BP-322]
MSRTLKMSLALVVVFAAALAVFLVMDRSGTPDAATAQQASTDPASIAVRENSHRLNTAPDGRVTFVEFLDFECEACRSAYPAIEQLREEYGDRVTFVARYFPIASHFNAERAARAVEAAAQQGEFEAMYQRMYETQEEWGEQRTPKDELFRSFAVDLGLDMTTFDAAYTDPATLERIQADVTDGTALGVQGTPTFFLNGEKIEPRTYGDLADALDAALG